MQACLKVLGVAYSARIHAEKRGKEEVLVEWERSGRIVDC